MDGWRCSIAALSLAAVLLAGASPGTAATPMETIQESNGKVLEIYADNEEIDEAAEGRIFGIIDGATDFAAIADAVTARFCRKLDEAQCRTFNEVFIRLLRTSSTKKLGRYRADSFDYLAEEVEGDSAVVRTAAHFQDEAISLDYSLALKEDRWVIVNYVVDDVDTIRNYKKQFTRLFNRKTFDEVIEKLEKRIAAYEEE